MILVDTSVLIDFFNNTQNDKVRKFKQVLVRNIPFGITSLVYQEVLQGVKDEKQFNELRDYLEALPFYNPLNEFSSYAHAAKMYFDLRRKGITVRSTIDCLIVQIAKEHSLRLLHNDKDFDPLIQEAGIESV